MSERIGYIFLHRKTKRARWRLLQFYESSLKNANRTANGWRNAGAHIQIIPVKFDIPHFVGLANEDIKSLQAGVGRWHIATFGECSNKRIARKLLEEAAEFMVEQSAPNPEKKEAADVLIALMAWAHRNEVDLVSLAAEKFEEVRNRD